MGVHQWARQELESSLERARTQGFDPLMTLRALLSDQHGHLAGDYALCLVAHTLRNQLRPKDSMVRYGGEEFVILLPELDAVEARTIGERLRQSLAQIESFYSPVGILPGVTVSIGMAQMQDKDGLESLIARADCALYKAKQKGRNCLYG